MAACGPRAGGQPCVGHWGRLLTLLAAAPAPGPPRCPPGNPTACEIPHYPQRARPSTWQVSNKYFDCICMSSAVCCLLALGRDCHSGAVKAPFPPVPPQPSGRASVDGAPSQCPANEQGFASYKSKSSESPSGASHLQGSALHGHRIATCSAFLGARFSSHSQPHFLVLMPSCSPPHQVLGLAMWLALTNGISAM